MTIKAGQLRNRVTIQAPSTARDGMGQPSKTFTDWQTVWARIVSMGGAEQFKGQQYSPEVTHQVTMRWLDGVTPMHRLTTEDGKLLDILYVNYGERRIDDTLILICKERLGVSGDEAVN
jgi:SPP1 family predicted phage head-tail adaptor